VLLRVKVAEVASQKQMIFELACRAHRDQHEAAEFRVSTPIAALGDVGRNRCGATAKLRGKPVRFLLREFAGGFVDAQGEPVALLPNLQLPKVPHLQVIGPSVFPD